MRLPPEQVLIAEVLRWRAHYQAGLLPNEGGVLRQNPFLLDCILLVNGIENEEQANDMKDRRRDSHIEVDSGRAGVLGKLEGPVGPDWRERLKPAE